MIATIGCRGGKQAVVRDEAPTAPPDPSFPPFRALPDAQRADYEVADAIVVARLVNPKQEGMLLSKPPIYGHSFDVSVDKQLAGAPFPHVGLRFSSRDPVYANPFVAGSRMVVAVRVIEQTLKGPDVLVMVIRLDPATPALVAAVGGAFRPAPYGLRMTIAQVPPLKLDPYRNDYGDGLFDLTIINDGKEMQVVPGVYVVRAPKGDEVFFDEALEIRRIFDPAFEVRRDEHVMHVAHVRRPVDAIPLELLPGESVTKRVDVKPLEPNPIGFSGSRLYYSFGIGSLKRSSFFFCYGMMHGPLMGKPP